MLSGKTSKLLSMVTVFLCVVSTTYAQEIFRVIRGGDIAQVNTLLDEDPSQVNAKDGAERTPLHYAVILGNIELAQLCIDKGAKLSVRNSDGDTPLNLALFLSKKKDLIDLLLEHGADYDGSGIKALAMLQASARRGLVRMFLSIIDKEGDRLFADKEQNKWTLQDVVTSGSLELLSHLIDRGFTIKKGKDRYGWTLVHYAAAKGHTEMLEYLVRQGIDINLRTNAGESAYNLADRNNHNEIQDVIIELGGRNDTVQFPVLKGPYLGQKPPGLKPKIFAPGVVSRPDFIELSITVSSAGDEFFFYGWSDSKDLTIYHTRIANGLWIFPGEFPLTAKRPSGLPFLSFDNTKLFFKWQDSRHHGMWVTERTDEGWADPQPSGKGFYVTQSGKDGFYITELPSQENDHRYHIAKVKIVNNRMTDYKRVHFPDQTGHRAHPCIAPDGSFILFDSGGGEHLRVAFRQKDGTWGKALDLTEYGFERLAGMPAISPDGKYLFFKLGCRGALDISHSKTNRDIWWVDIQIIETLRTKEYK